MQREGQTARVTFARGDVWLCLYWGEGATIIIRSRNPGEQGSKAKVKANLACVASVSSRVVRAGAKKKQTDITEGCAGLGL